MRTSNPCARGRVAQLKREAAVCLSVPYISLRPILFMQCHESSRTLVEFFVCFDTSPPSSGGCDQDWAGEGCESLECNNECHTSKGNPLVHPLPSVGGACPARAQSFGQVLNGCYHVRGLRGDGLGDWEGVLDRHSGR